MVSAAAASGLILFAHGARDPRWREPFERVREEAAARHAGPVVLAFLELMSPTLQEAAHDLAAAGVTRATVVPLFLGVGRHLREDLPGLVAQARDASGLELRVVPAAGEDPEVVSALAACAVRAGTAV